MRIQYIVLLGVSLMLTSCFSKSLYTREQYDRMSDDEIKTIMLSHTPIGSTKQEVKLFIKKKLKEIVKFDKTKNMLSAIIYVRDGNIFKYIPAKILHIHYLFDDNDKLIDVTVGRVEMMK